MSTPRFYTCANKGGRYERLGVSKGAGTRRLERLIAYRDTETGELYHRTIPDFDARMIPIEEAHDGR